MHTLHDAKSEWGRVAWALSCCVQEKGVYGLARSATWLTEHRSMLGNVVGSNATQDSSFFFDNDRDVLLENEL